MQIRAQKLLEATRLRSVSEILAFVNSMKAVKLVRRRRVGTKALWCADGVYFPRDFEKLSKLYAGNARCM